MDPTLLAQGGVPPVTESVIVQLIKALVIFVVILQIVPMVLLAERKLLGRFQNRYGPNRVGPHGMMQPLADIVTGAAGAKAAQMTDGASGGGEIADGQGAGAGQGAVRAAQGGRDDRPAVPDGGRADDRAAAPQRRVGSRPEQQSGLGVASVDDREHEGREAVLGGVVERGAVLDEQVDAGRELVEGAPHRRHQELALVGQQQSPVEAPEQQRAEMLLQRLDLMADRGLGHVELVGGAGEAQMARRGLDDRTDTQVAGLRGRPPADLVGELGGSLGELVAARERALHALQSEPAVP